MDVHSLDGAVQHYFTAALAQSSHKTYKAAANKYITFCESFMLSPLPTSEAMYIVLFHSTFGSARPYILYYLYMHLRN